MICLQMGKPTRQKSHRVILRSPLLRIHYYQNKRLQVKESQYLIPTYSWTLTSIPSWTCSVMTISPFQCTAPTTWLTNCVDPSMRLKSPIREGCWLQNSSVHHIMKIKKLLGHKTLRYTNIAASSQERWTRANSISSHNLLKQNFAQHLWEKKAQTYNHRLDEKQSRKTEFHKPQ